MTASDGNAFRILNSGQVVRSERLIITCRGCGYETSRRSAGGERIAG